LHPTAARVNTIIVPLNRVTGFHWLSGTYTFQSQVKTMTSSTPVPRGKSLLLSILLPFIGIAPVAAEEPSTLSLKAVMPYSAEFDYFLEGEQEAEEKAGSWTDLVHIDNGLLSRMVTRYTNDGTVDMVRAVIVDRETIAPVRIQQRFGPALTNVYQLEFNQQTLTQILIGDAASPARGSTTELSEPVVETGLQAVFALSLPMERTGEVTVTTYQAGAEPKISAKTFHIVGQESVEVLGQALDAWRIEDRASQWTYWVRRDMPYILKVVHPAPGGKTATSILTGFSPLTD